ncbi:MAG: hypothetical protein MJ137_00840 [Clostridia bacterium]|nr:hypothetical protein [Clostridia bacterium]
MNTIFLKHTEKTPVCIAFPPAITTHAFEAAERLSVFIADLTSIKPVRTTCDVPAGRDAVLPGKGAPAAAGKGFADVKMFGICTPELICNKSENGENSMLGLLTASEETLQLAVEKLIMSLKPSDGGLVCDASFLSESFTLPRYIKYLPVPAGGAFAADRRSHMSCDQTVYTGVDENVYLDYLEKVSASGFSKVSEREVCGNRFARFIRSGVAAYIYYTPYNSTLRMIAEPESNMHTDRALYRADRNVKPLMTVIGARFSTTSRYLNCDSGCGNMGYVFRLGDGRFIIVDGGTEIGDYADRIMDTLRSQSEGGKIRIACWFMSHTHIDHTGAFLKISQAYADEIEIEEIACNFPSIPDAEAYREAWNTRRVGEAAFRVFPNAAFTKPHTGEVFRYGSTEIEVICCQDDTVSRYFSILNDGYTLNSASLCIRLRIAGNTVILPADCDEVCGKIMTGMYGDYLKSDILQVCHHGGWGGSTALYEKIDPELAIFSTSDELLPKYLQIQYNHDLVYGMHVVEVHNNADRCRTFELPYHPTEKVIPPDPKEDILYTKAKQLEALAAIELLRKAANEEKR